MRRTARRMLMIRKGGYHQGAPQDMMNSTQPMGGYDGNGQPSVQDIVDQELKAAGASPSLIRGFHYNINAESGWDPNLRHVDQPRWGGEAHYSHGLLQEGGPEWGPMQDFANKAGTGWQDPRTQIQYAVQNLKQSGVWDRMNSHDNWQDSAADLAKNYLRPAAPYLQSRLNNIYGNKDYRDPASAGQPYGGIVPQSSGNSTTDPSTAQALQALTGQQAQQGQSQVSMAMGLLNKNPAEEYPYQPLTFPQVNLRHPADQDGTRTALQMINPQFQS